MPRMFVTLFLLTALGAPLSAQGDVNADELKDPLTAKRYAFYFSGGGHFYAGEPLLGGVLVGTSALGLYKMLDELGCSAATRVVFADLGCSRGTAFLWLGLAAASYVYGIVDAPRSAERVNAKRVAPARTLTIIPGLAALQSGYLQGRLSFHFSF